jgi:hypothetical protein
VVSAGRVIVFLQDGKVGVLIINLILKVFLFFEPFFFSLSSDIRGAIEDVVPVTPVVLFSFLYKIINVFVSLSAQAF